jgi:hypothetical protein
MQGYFYPTVAHTAETAGCPSNVISYFLAPITESFAAFATRNRMTVFAGI